MVSLLMVLENDETECIKGNENKENKNVDKFHKSTSKQEPANIKLKTESDMRAWKQFRLPENESRELCDIPAEEMRICCCANVSKP